MGVPCVYSSQHRIANEPRPHVSESHIESNVEVWPLHFESPVNPFETHVRIIPIL